MTLIIFMFVFLICMFLVFKKCRSPYVLNLAKCLTIVFAIMCVLEVTLFNFRFYESLGYKEIKVNNYTLGSGLREDKNGNIKVVSEEYNYIEINGINEHLDNIYLNFDTDDTYHKVLDLSIGYTDEANKRIAFPQDRRVSSSKLNDGEILRLHLAGKSSRIRIYVKTIRKSSTFRIEDISFNKKVQMNVSFIRPALALFLALIVYIFRPKSIIYQMNLFDKKNRKYITLVVVLQILLFGGISQLNQYFVKENFRTPQRMQYQLLTEAFTKGQTYLDIEPHPILKNLKNPYDTYDRDKTFENLYKGIDDTKQPDDYYIWDAAFFNNRYYVYFGVAPVITYYLPYYVLTGHHITTVNCTIITMVFTVIGIALLLYEFCKKWFKNTNLGAFIVIFILFVNACGILSIMGRPDHYSLPILMGIMFSVYGLLFWFKALEKDLKTGYLFLGSLCMASVAACRPQLLLSSFLVFPLFWDKVFKERKLFSKDSIIKTFLWILPYIVIALLLMYYNYVRFGSPFDFGANYNLTTNDMTRRGFVFDRTPLGIYYYLFRPFNLVLKFPFIMRDAVSTNYMGTTIFEEMGAGFLVCNLICLFGVLIFKWKKEFKDKMPYKIGVVAVISSLIIIIADTQMAGILPRYICDFGYLLYLATAIVIFNKISKNKDNSLLHKIIFYSLIFGLIYNFLLLFSDSVLYNSVFYYYIRSLFEFWV